MENFKGTKGEWDIYRFDGDIHITDESNIQSICKLPPKYEHTEANAKLIAASKDLLEALKLLVEETENYVSENADNGRYLKIARDKSYNAINKATL